jgi:hypothetical protein
MNEFFGLSRRKFTQSEIEKIAKHMSDALAEYFARKEGYGG